MPNPQPPTSTPAPKINPSPIPGSDGFDRNAADANAAPQDQGRDDTDSEDGDSDRVEIGEPVPQDDRTVRALDDGSDEELPATGEDDDTVDPDRDPSGERH